jgi:hypothetical protein
MMRRSFTLRLHKGLGQWGSAVETRYIRICWLYNSQLQGPWSRSEVQVTGHVSKQLTWTFFFLRMPNLFFTLLWASREFSMHSSVWLLVCVCVCVCLLRRSRRRLKVVINTLWISYLQAKYTIHRMSREVIHSLYILWNMGDTKKRGGGGGFFLGMLWNYKEIFY